MVHLDDEAPELYLHSDAEASVEAAREVAAATGSPHTHANAPARLLTVRGRFCVRRAVVLGRSQRRRHPLGVPPPDPGNTPWGEPAD